MESIVHIELEPGRILELCEAHFKRLRSFLGAPSVSIPSTDTEPIIYPIGYWNVVTHQI